MNSEEIDKILRRICNFNGVHPKDQLPSPPTLMVVNTDPASRPGKHWIAIWIDDKGHGELFDSLAQVPDKILTSYMDKHCVNWTYSKRQLQSVVSRFCGNYVVFYCAYRSIGYSLTAITSMFSNDTGLNDVLVHEFVCRRR